MLLVIAIKEAHIDSKVVLLGVGILLDLILVLNDLLGCQVFLLCILKKLLENILISTSNVLFQLGVIFNCIYFTWGITSNFLEDMWNFYAILLFSCLDGLELKFFTINDGIMFLQTAILLSIGGFLRCNFLFLALNFLEHLLSTLFHFLFKHSKRSIHLSINLLEMPPCAP